MAKATGQARCSAGDFVVDNQASDAEQRIPGKATEGFL
jgi:hypothetical protein